MGEHLPTKRRQLEKYVILWVQLTSILYKALYLTTYPAYLEVYIKVSDIQGNKCSIEKTTNLNVELDIKGDRTLAKNVSLEIDQKSIKFSFGRASIKIMTACMEEHYYHPDPETIFWWIQRILLYNKKNKKKNDPFGNF